MNQQGFISRTIKSRTTLCLYEKCAYFTYYMIINVKSLDATQSIEAQTQRWNEDCSIYSVCCTVSLYRNMQDM